MGSRLWLLVGAAVVAIVAIVAFSGDGGDEVFGVEEQLEMEDTEDGAGADVVEPDVNTGG
ncbi:hypothetical protein ACG74X_08755 [Marivita sp. S0852]|uniref:hypothetical protein n=1 Tax=Marivita sp. S0852 TaxID=3373893 RepID=UPI0039827FC9